MCICIFCVFCVCLGGSFPRLLRMENGDNNTVLWVPGKEKTGGEREGKSRRKEREGNVAGGGRRPSNTEC